VEQWRQYAYSKAAKILRGLNFEVESAAQVKHIKGIGKKVEAKIQEIISTGELRRLNDMQSNPRLQVIESLCKVHGVESRVDAPHLQALL